MKSVSWLQQKERSNTLAMRFIVWVTLKIGRNISYLMLYPICFYYLLFLPKRSLTASKKFLQKVLPHPVKWRHMFHHYYVFATTLIDRAHFLKGNYSDYTIKMNGLDVFRETIAKNRGCLLLGAHFGTFDVLRLLASEHNVPVKALMYQENAVTFRRIMRQLNPGMDDMVIEIGRPDTLLKVKESLSQGYCIGLLGDRWAQGERTVSCQFLSEAANFPSGPLLLASILHVPVVLMFGVQERKSVYSANIELFAENIELPRQSRQESLQQWVQKFADRLEEYVKQSPYNWFNFYDFWQASTTENETNSQ